MGGSANPDRLKRHDPRREATRVALIEAAESLFAENGVEGVSTRQIGTAIGSANTNVVAYHFGSKEALIEAVYRHRLPAIDRRRGVLLDRAIAQGSPLGVAELVRIFATPLLEQVDAAGQHSYARFINGLERSGAAGLRSRVIPDFPETQRLTALLGDCLPDEVRPILGIRLRLMAGIICTALTILDREAATAGEAQRMFDNAVAMAAAALAAPIAAGAHREGKTA